MHKKSGQKLLNIPVLTNIGREGQGRAAKPLYHASTHLSSIIYSSKCTKKKVALGSRATQYYFVFSSMESERKFTLGICHLIAVTHRENRREKRIQKGFLVLVLLLFSWLAFGRLAVSLSGFLRSGFEFFGKLIQLFAPIDSPILFQQFDGFGLADIQLRH